MKQTFIEKLFCQCCCDTINFLKQTHFVRKKRWNKITSAAGQKNLFRDKDQDLWMAQFFLFPYLHHYIEYKMIIKMAFDYISFTFHILLLLKYLIDNKEIST